MFAAAVGLGGANPKMTNASGLPLVQRLGARLLAGGGSRNTVIPCAGVMETRTGVVCGALWTLPSLPRRVKGPGVGT